MVENKIKSKTQQRQQQLLNKFRLCRVWGDLDVNDLASTSKLANREIISNRPTENLFFK